jgi:benzoate-CoA ligase
LDAVAQHGRSSGSSPRIDIPRDYNAAHDLIERNLAAGRAGKIAYVDDAGSYTYGGPRRARQSLRERARRARLAAEERVLLCHLDTIDFPSVFLGAIKAGIVPIAANTLLTTADYDYMLRDSRARALVVSAPLLPASRRSCRNTRTCRTSSSRERSGGEVEGGALVARRVDSPRRRLVPRGRDDVR